MGKMVLKSMLSIKNSMKGFVFLEGSGLIKLFESVNFN